VPVCGSLVAIFECAHPVELSIEAVFGGCSGRFGGSALFGHQITQFRRLVTAFSPSVSFLSYLAPEPPRVKARAAHVQFRHGAHTLL
jgi:hypothetical protein